MIKKTLLFFFGTLIFCSSSLYAADLPENTFAFTNNLFGLAPESRLDDLKQYGLSPSPFGQADSYLLENPPTPPPDFPIIVATATDKSSLCQVSGSFAIEKDSPKAVETLLRFVIHFSNAFGRPTSTDQGVILWENISNNPLGIKDVSILTDQLPSNITLITIVYSRSEAAFCTQQIKPLPQITVKKPNKKTACAERQAVFLSDIIRVPAVLLLPFREFQ